MDAHSRRVRMGCRALPQRGLWCTCGKYIIAFWGDMEEEIMGTKRAFGERLRAIRTARGLTQEELAGVFKVSSVMISKYESGLNFPETELLIAMANYFGVTVDGLLGRSPLTVADHKDDK